MAALTKFRVVPLTAAGVSLATDSFILPGGGLVIGVQWAATYASVTNAAYFCAAITTTQFAASADFDANASKNPSILSVIRGSVGFSTSGLAFEAVNLWVPLAWRVAKGGYIYLQAISATNGISCTACVHVMEP